MFPKNKSIQRLRTINIGSTINNNVNIKGKNKQKIDEILEILKKVLKNNGIDYALKESKEVKKLKKNILEELKKLTPNSVESEELKRENMEIIEDLNEKETLRTILKEIETLNEKIEK